MIDTERLALWQLMRTQGLATPEAFAQRYGRRLCDLTPRKALEILTTKAVHHGSPPVKKETVREAIKKGVN